MYQVLARKYRPRNFSELVGQTHVAKALISALDRGRLHHAYLFTGTRGVGKTTIARILAKCLNCETGVTSTPCEQCDACRAVNEGRFMDLIEIDAASRTGVDDTRELIENVPYAPTQGRYKVYLIDEVHMLSPQSFNALLKTLEEPPEHVKFIFATTDPQRILITVISRCLQFALRPLAKQEIYQHLDNILQKEHIEHESQALWQLAESAQGSMRDALSLTDQAIAFGQGKIAALDVKEMLGLIDKRLIFDLLSAISQNQRTQVAHILQTMRQQALDITHVLEQLIAILHEIALCQCIGEVQPSTDENQQYIQQLAQFLSPQDIQLYYQIALQGRADLPLALTPEQGFEMCIMRLLAFRPLNVGEVVAEPTVPMIASTVEAKPNPKPQPIQEQATVEDVAVLQEFQDDVLNEEQVEEIIQQQHHDETKDTASDVTVNTTTEMQIQTDETTPLSEVTAVVENTSAESEMPVEASVEMSVSAELLSNDTGSHKPLPLEQENHHPLITESPNIPSDTDPRDLLSAPEQQLDGQWSLEKWDYWLRNSELSPAVLEIAQRGIMQGAVDGDCTLSLDSSYQMIFAQFEKMLQDKLKQQFMHNRCQFSYQKITTATPYEMQQQRKQLAATAAQQQMLQHPTIAQLSQQFQAQLTNVQLKTS